MELLGYIKYGTPALVFGMILMLERINTTVKTIREDLREIKEGMTWHDTCVAKHEEINRRLARLEKAANGTLETSH